MIDKEYVTIALSRLYPEGCLFKGNPEFGDFVWQDDRPYPTQDIEDEIVLIKAEFAKIDNNKLAKKNYEIALSEGYKHTDGNTYVCTRDGVIDMCLAVTLINEAPDEPVYVIDILNKVVEMTMAEFKTLAVACGNYHYDLRQWYWGSLRQAPKEAT